MPPLASICIMRDVPHRGKPETMTISFSMLNILKMSKIDVQRPTKTKTGNHRHDEPVDDPRVGAARPRRAIRIVDLDGLNRRVSLKRLLPRIDQGIEPAPGRTQLADSHEAIADGQFFFD